MAKFKVGDRVRVTDESGSDAYKVGEVGTVARVTAVKVGEHTQLVELEGKNGSAMFGERFEPAAVAPATAAPEVEITGTLEFTSTTAVGDDVLIPGWITAINHSAKGTVYGIAFETKNRRVSLHFLEEDFIAVDEGDCPCFSENDNGPLMPNTAAAFDDLCGSIFGLTMRAA